MSEKRINERTRQILQANSAYYHRLPDCHCEQKDQRIKELEEALKEHMKENKEYIEKLTKENAELKVQIASLELMLGWGGEQEEKE